MTIFAKVSVDLLDHQRVLRIPRSVRASCLGTWLAALIYTRKHELDGFCPADVVDVIAGEDVLEWLVKVELLSRDEQDGVHGFRILRYELHNETRSTIDMRRSQDRARKAKIVPNGSQKESDGKPSGTRKASVRKATGKTQEATRIHAKFPGSDSDSDSGSGSPISDLSKLPPPGDLNGTRASIVTRDPPRLADSMTDDDYRDERDRQLRAAADFVRSEDEKKKAAQ